MQFSTALLIAAAAATPVLGQAGTAAGIAGAPNSTAVVTRTVTAYETYVRPPVFCLGIIHVMRLEHHLLTSDSALTQLSSPPTRRLTPSPRRIGQPSSAQRSAPSPTTHPSQPLSPLVRLPSTVTIPSLLALAPRDRLHAHVTTRLPARKSLTSVSP